MPSAFAQMKKGLKDMFRKRSKATHDEKSSQSTATSSETGQSATTTTTSAAPSPAVAPVESGPAPVEMSSNEPVKIPMVVCTRRQEATEGQPLSTTNGTAAAAATKPPTSPNPEFVVTPPSGEEEPSIPDQLDQDIKPGKYDGSHTDADAPATTTKSTPAAIVTPTSQVSEHDTSVTTPKLETERPVSPAPEMSATSGPLDDHPTFA